MNDYGLLPRHRFTETHVTCGVHGHDSDCLCDVNVHGSWVVPNEATRGLMFGKLALEAIGAEHLTRANIGEWASVLLGCHERYLALPKPDELPEYDDGYDEFSRDRGGPRKHDVPIVSGRKKTTAWTRLPLSVREMLLIFARRDLPWHVAFSALPGYVPDEDVIGIKKYYRQQRSKWRKTRKDEPNV